MRLRHVPFWHVTGKQQTDNIQRFLSLCSSRWCENNHLQAGHTDFVFLIFFEISRAGPEDCGPARKTI